MTAAGPGSGRPNGSQLAAMTACTAVAAGCGAMLAAPRLTTLPPSIAFAGGVVVAVLVVLGLPMVPLRIGVLATVGSAAFLVVLRGTTATAGASAPLVVGCWAAASVAAVALAERSTLDRHPVLPGSPPPSGWGDVSAGVVVTALVGILLAALISPALGAADESPRSSGDAPDAAAGSSEPGLLRSSPSLDMTGRPRLSDRVVLTVRADRPAFWRGQTYDAWDGDTWTNTEPAGTPVGAVVVSDPYDIGARSGDRFTQRITVEAPYADLLFAAASPVEVRSPGFTYGHPDGTVSTEPLGRGAGYTVVSRRLPVTEESLRAAEGSAPQGLLDRYASEPATTERVRDTARRVTAGADTTYDQVRAIERWMGDTTEYSLDAPLSPKGVDVVDHFLFDARQGWCEQIASSLVVMLRSIGVPARLVTGYTPGEANSLWGTFTVRERNAHAWAEVWFPGIGWQAFDPTAEVPLAGDAPKISVVGWLTDHVVLVIALLGLLALVVAVVLALRSGWLHTLWSRRSSTWAQRASRRLDRLSPGTRPRRPSETATAYGAVLTSAHGDPRLARVGRIIDEATFGGDVGESDRAFADGALTTARRDLRRARRSARWRRARLLVGSGAPVGAPGRRS
jgi:transglutaminase-like putative cysteine protease